MNHQPTKGFDKPHWNFDMNPIIFFVFIFKCCLLFIIIIPDFSVLARNFFCCTKKSTKDKIKQEIWKNFLIFSKKYNIISKHSGKVRNRRRGVREVYSAILERSCAERHRRFKSCPLRQTTALAQSRNRKEKPNCFSFSFSSILPRLRDAPECGHRPRDAPLCCAIPSRFALLTNPSSSAIRHNIL